MKLLHFSVKLCNRFALFIITLSKKKKKKVFMSIYESLLLFLQQSLESLDGKLLFKSKSVCLYLS